MNFGDLIQKNSKYIYTGLFVVVVGVVCAYLVFSNFVLKSGSTSTTTTGSVSGKNEVGILDSKIKYDSAIGKLVEGGIGNEGTYHLERDGGPSKYVYLTSSVVDLSPFVGKNVEVWGQTLASKKAGWLMDVAKVKIAND